MLFKLVTRRWRSLRGGGDRDGPDRGRVGAVRRRQFGRRIARFFRKSQPLAYVEMVIGLGVLVAINVLFFPEQLGFGAADPHPFWLVIIPIAARYGARPGYAVGALSAIVYLVLFAVGTGSISPSDLLNPRIALDPVLFLFVGAALGELRESHKREHKRVAARYEELERDLQDLAERYLASMELSRELERRIVGQTSTVTTLYRAAKALEGLDARELAPAVLELAESFVDAGACSLYLRDGDVFALEAVRPAGAGVARPDELDTTTDLPAIVFAEKRTATVRDVITEATPAQLMRQPLLMATPLLSEDGDVMGILIVERMPFLRFTPSAVKLFSLLGDWASSAFQRALRFQQTKDRNIEDELTGAYNYSYVLKRLNEEISRARRYGIPLTLLALGVNDYDGIPAIKLPLVLRTLGTVFRHGTRDSDILGRHAEEGVFLLVLTHTDADRGRVLADRLEREISAFGFKPFDDERDLSVSTGLSLASEGTGAESMVEEALRELRGGAEWR